jgi:aminopeptidase YwaD
MEEMKFDGSRAYEHVKVLSERIGARVSGTPQEKEAADYVQQQFENLGLIPQVLDFDVDQDEAVSFSLEILDPPLGMIHALPLVGTPDTPPEGLLGEIAFVETLKPPDVGPHLQGKIVFLVNGGLLGRDLQSLLKYDPLALVLVGKTIGSQPNTFHVIMKETNRPLALVPTLHITYADGVRLWNEGASKARVKLKTERSQGKSYAVYAEVRGSEFPDEIIVVAGHMDSVPRDPGATDNAAGIATMLELARLYASRGSRRTLRFAAWGSEEGGLVGSMRYVLSLKKKHIEERETPGYVEGYSRTELEKHLLNINLDVLGMPLGSNSFNVVGPPALRTYLLALSDELGIHHQAHSGLYGSDHLSFANVGVPGVSFQREGTAGQYMHTSQDDLSLIDSGQLERVGHLVDVFITRTAAQGWVWPFERSISELSPDLEQQLRKRIQYAVDFLGEDPDLLK